MLEFGGCSFLLDCGWNESLDAAALEGLKKVAQNVDVVLLSHPDTEHLGALPYAVCRLGLKAAIYATLPVVKMGQMFLYDLCLTSKSTDDSLAPDEIDTAFSKVKTLKYYEEQYLSDHGVTLTAHVAGHLVGGTVWQITKDEQEVVYAVDYNHRTEKHLSAFKHSTLIRPAVLITDAKDVHNSPIDLRKRDKSFFRTLLSVLRNGGNVLIPTDTAGRMLELVFMLEKYWSEHRLPYVLALLSKVAYSVIEFAKSQLEWMNADVAMAFERDRDNPFHLRSKELLTLASLQVLWVPIWACNSLSGTFFLS